MSSSTQTSKLELSEIKSDKKNENDKEYFRIKFSDIEKIFKAQNKKVIIISDKLYDITDFMFEHPGGADVLDFYVFKDATNAFYEIGHSNDAEDLLKDFLIGELE
jgi:cytochrome b5